MQIKQVTVTRVLKTGAFAMTEDGETAYIPLKVVTSIGCREGEEIFARLVDNRRQNARNVRWYAIYASREPIPELDDATCAAVRDALADVSYLTTQEVAAEINKKPRETGVILNAMFQAEQIARAQVFGKPGKVDPAFTLWARDEKSFLEAE